MAHASGGRGGGRRPSFTTAIGLDPDDSSSLRKRGLEEADNLPDPKKVDDKKTPQKSFDAICAEAEDLLRQEESVVSAMAALERGDGLGDTGGLTPAGELPPLTKEQEEALAAQNSQGADGNAAAKESYAAAAKKEKIDQDLILYVQRGKEKREPLPNSIWEVFIKQIMKTLMSMDVAVIQNVNIGWMDHKLGRGIICCLDSQTTAWVKAQAESFNHEGFTIRAWSRNEFGKRIIFQGFLHNKVFWWEKEGPSALAWILKINQIKDAGRFSVITYSKRPNGVWLRFESDPPLKEAIEAKKCKLSAGVCRLDLELKDDDDEEGEESSANKTANTAGKATGVKKPPSSKKQQKF